MFARIATMFRPVAPSAIDIAEADVARLLAFSSALDAKLARVKRREWADAPFIAHTLASIGKCDTPAACRAEAPAVARAKAEQARRWAILRAEGVTLNSSGGVL